MPPINIGGGLAIGPAASVASATPAAVVSGALAVADGVADGSRIISAIDGSMPTASTRTISVGRDASANNQGDLSFYYAGPGSSSNYLAAGLHNTPQLFLTPAGVGVNTATPGAAFDVVGGGRFAGNLTVGGGLNANTLALASINTGDVQANNLAVSNSAAVGALTATVVTAGNASCNNLSVSNTFSLVVLTTGTVSANNINVSNAATVGALSTGTGIQAGTAAGNPGDLIAKVYSAGDRYGVGQYSGGRSRLITSSAFAPATVGMALCGNTSNGTAAIVDILVANANTIVLLQPAVANALAVLNGASVAGALTAASISTVGTLSSNNSTVSNAVTAGTVIALGNLSSNNSTVSNAVTAGSMSAGSVTAVGNVNAGRVVANSLQVGNAATFGGSVATGALTASGLVVTGGSTLAGTSTGALVCNGFQAQVGNAVPVLFAGPGANGAQLITDFSTFPVLYGNTGNGSVPTVRLQVTDTGAVTGPYTGVMNLQQCLANATTMMSRLFMNANGQFGFGTTTPVHVVDVQGNVRASANLISQGAVIDTVTSNNLSVSNAFTINALNTSNVIASTLTVSNTATLAQVAATGLYTQNLQVQVANAVPVIFNTVGGTNAALNVDLSTYIVNYSGNAGTQGTLPTVRWTAVDGGLYNASLNLQQATGNATALASRMFMSTAGQFGFGTTAPAHAVDVVGNVRASRSMLADTVASNTLSVSNVVTVGSLTAGGATCNTLSVANGANVTGNLRGATILAMNNQVNNQMICLYNNEANLSSTSTNFAGFGIGSNTLRYQVGDTKYHSWYAGNLQVANLSSTQLSVPGAIAAATLSATGALSVAGGSTLAGTSTGALVCNGFQAQVGNAVPVLFAGPGANGAQLITDFSTFPVLYGNTGNGSVPTVRLQVTDTGAVTGPYTGVMNLQQSLANATAMASRLFMDANGQFGIGTTVPGQTVDVVGNVRASGNITSAGAVFGAVTAANLAITNTFNIPSLSTGNVSANNLSVSNAFSISALSTGTVNAVNVNVTTALTTANASCNNVTVSNSATVTANLYAGNLNTGTFINACVPTGDPGDLITKVYGAADRYGLGQYTLGRTRVVTSSTYTPASVGLALCGNSAANVQGNAAAGGIVDLIVANSSAIQLLQPTTANALTVTNGATVTGALTSGALTAASVSTTANVTAANLNATNSVVATGTVSGATVTSTGNVNAGRLVVSGNAQSNNLQVSNAAAVTGAVTAGSLSVTGGSALAGTSTGALVCNGFQAQVANAVPILFAGPGANGAQLITDFSTFPVLYGNSGNGSVPTVRLQVTDTGATSGPYTGVMNLQQCLANATSMASRVFMNASGQIGFGTTTPASGYTVDIAGGLRTTGTNFQQASGGGYYMGSALSANNAGFISFNVGTPSATNSLGLGIWGQPTGITVAPTGNVGIGATSPAYNLDVAGSTRITNGLFLNNLIQNQVLTLYTNDTTLNSASTNYVGFGVNSNTLRYQVAANQVHTWYAGTTQVLNMSTSAMTYTGNQLAVGGTGSTSTALFSQCGSSGAAYLGLDTSTYGACIGVSQTAQTLGFGVGVGQNNYGSATVRMALNSSGMLGISTATPAYTCDVAGNSRVTGTMLQGTSTDTNRAISCLNSAMATGTQNFITVGQGASTNNQAEFFFNYAGSGSANNAFGLGVFGTQILTGTVSKTTVNTALNVPTSNTAAQFVVGNSSAITNSNAPAQFYNTPNVRAAIATYTGATTIQNHIEFFSSQQTGLVGSISTSGAATSFNTSSDRRLKNDIQALANAATLVQALRPVDFLFKSEVETEGDGAQRFAGFIADEVQQLVPRAVNGEKDGVDADGKPQYQTMDASKLIPWLVAALQGTMAEVAQLKEQIASRV